MAASLRSLNAATISLILAFRGWREVRRDGFELTVGGSHMINYETA